jgi:hypothetical protein
MQKISGGNLLECGHTQVISAFRYSAYQTGRNQRPVWCIECNSWSNITPAPITEEPQEEVVDGLDNPGGVVLDFPVNESDT